MRVTRFWLSLKCRLIINVKSDFQWTLTFNYCIKCEFQFWRGGGFLSTHFHRCEIITDLGWMLLSNHCHLPEELVKFAIPVRNLCIQSNVWQARWRKTKNKTLKSCLIQGFYWEVRNFLMTQFKLKNQVLTCGEVWSLSVPWVPSTPTWRRNNQCKLQ